MTLYVVQVAERSSDAGSPVETFRFFSSLTEAQNYASARPGTATVFSVVLATV